ncbi:hypothetical protein [Shimwellia blattae]|uniref:Tail spike TSP1/Gp66 N-terminal domain-containing protein n=2 Tax=Shimwellia blattae TaxID=563 RepID=I2BBY9_SHIBC|nr:hypothetical protein [Shimwellia blattae]AAX12962.1 hypothetical protein [Shimwellia blattae DSM 4481 = NBRC 105725]AFJ48043.1 hypothetical protein EBL_c29730 [Shimwellia blattae DSM 4481 = NBRC 105725]VDY65542.1 Uncharacterised protein [Shimwellia blattae]VEC24896.1 Uncharacterised protein [Shimwellia blattae]GAB81969.1 hypothetical protein EB105725_18_00980 [Shimwellia blattae DSM 4481 = NBRC 105725]
MYHLDNTSGVPEMPEPKEQQSITPRWFGESQEQGGISWPGADWFNVVQAELLNLLAAANIQPDKKSYDQLSKAIPKLGDAKLRTDLKSNKPGDGLSLAALIQGGTGQDAINYVTPFMYGGIGNSPSTDNTAAVIGAITVALNFGFGIDLTGGPWRITRTIDFTNVRKIRTDWTGRLLVNPANFTALHSANFVVTLGNPDTAFREDRCIYTCIDGCFAVVSDSRATELNGIFIKGQLLSIDSLRVIGFNGSGIYMGAVWDSAFKSISVELSGNQSLHAIAISPFGDTSNCLHIGRIQCEQAYHKQLYINAIRSEFHTIHAERAYITTLDDGATGLPSALNYQNSYFLLSNSAIYQMIIDAASSTSIGTVTTAMSVTLNLYASVVCAANIGGAVSATYGNYSEIIGSFFVKYYNRGYPVKLSSCRFTTSDNSCVVDIANCHLVNCEIDTLLPYYGCDYLHVTDCIIMNDYSCTRTDISGVLFDHTTFKKNVGSTGPTETSRPTKLRDCEIMGQLTGAFQHRLLVEGGYCASVNLLSRAYVRLSNVRGGTFSAVGDRAYITIGCEFNSIMSWGVPDFGNYKVSVRTQRMGAFAAGMGLEYINTVDGGASFKAILTAS